MLLNTHRAQGTAPTPGKQSNPEVRGRHVRPGQRGLIKAIHAMNECGRSFRCPPPVVEVLTVQTLAAHRQATVGPPSPDSPSCHQGCAWPGDLGNRYLGWRCGGGTTCLCGHESDAQTGQAHWDPDP